MHLFLFSIYCHNFWGCCLPQSSCFEVLITDASAFSAFTLPLCVSLKTRSVQSGDCAVLPLSCLLDHSVVFFNSLDWMLLFFLDFNRTVGVNRSVKVMTRAATINRPVDWQKINWQNLIKKVVPDMYIVLLAWQTHSVICVHVCVCILVLMCIWAETWDNGTCKWNQGFYSASIYFQ